jgi:hypothetical protein
MEVVADTSGLACIGFPLIFHGSKAMGVKFVPELMRIGTHTYCPKLERINCKSGNSIVGNETDTLPKVIRPNYYKNSTHQLELSL